MEKKEIIYQLAKGIIEKGGRKRYSGMRRRLKKNISEIALYSAIADHIEENSINPSNMIKIVSDFIEELGENPFAIKTNNDFHYLAKRWDDLSISNNPPEDLKFLCPYCYIILPNSSRSKKQAYPTACRKCGDNEAKLSAKASYMKKKTEVVEPTSEKEIIPEVEIIPEIPVAQKVEVMPKIELSSPFINITNMMGNSSSGMDIELRVKFTDTMKLLTLIEDHVISSEQIESTIDEAANG